MTYALGDLHALSLVATRARAPPGGFSTSLGSPRYTRGSSCPARDETDSLPKTSLRLYEDWGQKFQDFSDTGHWYAPSKQPSLGQDRMGQGPIAHTLSSPAVGIFSPWRSRVGLFYFLSFFSYNRSWQYGVFSSLGGPNPERLRPRQHTRLTCVTMYQ